jgi:hypothetical protein
MQRSGFLRGAMSRTSGFKPLWREMAPSKRHSVTTNLGGETARTKIRLAIQGLFHNPGLRPQ